MLKRWLFLIAACAWFPLQSFAAITATTLIPIGTEYWVANTIALPTGAYYGYVGSTLNQEMVHFNTPRPPTVAAGNSRHTVAMDVHFFGDALTRNSAHLILATRHKGNSWLSPGDNRSGAIVAGTLWNIAGLAGVEEIEMGDDKLNQPRPVYSGSTLISPGVHAPGPGILTTGRWYRISVETISLSGSVALEARIWDLSAGGGQIYSSGTIWSAFPANYDLSNGRVTIASILYGATAGASISNLKSYWSNGGEWVANP